MASHVIGMKQTRRNLLGIKVRELAGVRSCSDSQAPVKYKASQWGRGCWVEERHTGLHLTASVRFSVEDSPWRRQGCSQPEDHCSKSDGDSDQGGSSGGVKKRLESGNTVKVELIWFSNEERSVKDTKIFELSNYRMDSPCILWTDLQGKVRSSVSYLWVWDATSQSSW